MAKANMASFPLEKNRILAVRKSESKSRNDVFFEWSIPVPRASFRSARRSF
jgi:hypothetical protein